MSDATTPCPGCGKPRADCDCVTLGAFAAELRAHAPTVSSGDARPWERMLAELRRAGIEPGNFNVGWFVAAEPGPVECDTLDEAVRLFARLEVEADRPSFLRAVVAAMDVVELATGLHEAYVFRGMPAAQAYLLAALARALARPGQEGGR